MLLYVRRFVDVLLGFLLTAFPGCTASWIRDREKMLVLLVQCHLCHITALEDNMTKAGKFWVGPSRGKSVICFFLGHRSKDGVTYRFTGAPPNRVQYLLKYSDGSRNMALMYSICVLATKDIVTSSVQDQGVYTRRLLISQ